MRPIAEIQGTGATSPLDGQTVTTEGVVTASYPTGGLNGFYLQTPGTPDTPGASDAIFVYGGPSGFATSPAVGDPVRVTGTVGEFNTVTQITATSVAAAPSVTGTVTPKTTVPGTDCVLPGTDCLAGTALDAAREPHEGELFQPTADWTVTDSYDGSPFPSTSSNFFGEIGLAAGSDRALVQPTEVHDAQTESALVTARTRYNDAHRIVLDDGATVNYTTQTGQPYPWLTPTNTVRVGAAVTFPKPVVLTYGFGTWRVLPQSQAQGASTDKVAFEQDRPAAPAAVGGDIRLATFNVLNFFPTTGEEFVSSGLGSCTYFTDRAGQRTTTRDCGASGPRGAANDANLARQRDKIVDAIGKLGADVVALEEIENSVKFGKPRDFALDALVTALNAAQGAGTWAAVPSPPAAELPDLAEQDVIRPAFIYKPAKVALVGASKVLTGSAAFANAREPLGQVFKAVGRPDSQGYLVVANHFKSKGSGADDGTGQGLANPDRVAQAQALVTFADDLKTARGVDRVFLTGDFNAYSKEDPIQVLEDAGYDALEADDPTRESYNFGGLDGSLDHVLANAAAKTDVAGVDVWQINANESVFYEYSRFNANVTNLYDAGPYRSSDHNPEVVGIDLPARPPVEVQILGTNDFHGRLVDDPQSTAAGAAVLSGAVKQLRAQNPNTVFAAAGDLIGATTFDSFIDQDKPTIDALNEAGLEVSAVGNHEFDQGYDDLVNRVMNLNAAKGGARWKYLGANVRFKASNSRALEGTWIKEMDGVQVGFVGAVTEHLDELVSPAGIADIKVTDIVQETNVAAADLKTAGADVVVLLVHEGAPSTACETMASDPASDFARIITGVSDDVDAIVSGHTHLAYDCSFPVPGWAARPVTTRPVVSAGQYGSNLNKLTFTVDPGTGIVQARSQSILRLKATNAGPANYPVDGPTKTIVDAAVANAEVLGAQVLGRIGAPFNRAKLSTAAENRGGESSLGNLVAEVQRWATRNAESGSAQLAFMNPGGLRADLVGVTGALPRDVTFRQAATVQPFANTLVNMDLTGAQIKAALEQQWQPAGASRPFLKLGISKALTYTYDAALPQGSRITGIRVDGVPVTPTQTFSVTVNSFLASGGDNFSAFAGGTGKQDTGRTDLQAMVDYFAAMASGVQPPLALDASQRAVGVRFPSGAPSSYAPGATVAFSLSSLSMSTADDAKDANVTVKLGSATLGTFPVTTTAGTTPDDEIGTASVSVTVPANAPAGPAELVVEGATTGTRAVVPITVARRQAVTATGASVVWGQTLAIPVTVDGNAGTPTGTVELRDGTTRLVDGTLGAGGTATLTLPARSLDPGTRTVTVAYGGGGVYDAQTTTITVTVTKAPATVSAPTTAVPFGQNGTVVVTVSTPAGTTPTGTVRILRGAAELGSAPLGSDGRATVPVASSGLASGPSELTARYDGSTFLQDASSTFTYTVGAAPTPDPDPTPQPTPTPVTPGPTPGTPTPTPGTPGTGTTPTTPQPTPGPGTTPQPPVSGQGPAACVGNRRVTVTLRPKKGQKLRSGTATFRGRAVTLRKRGRVLVATIDLRGLREATYTVRLVGRTTTGRRVTATVRVKSCVRTAR
ncbi:multifunctional nuclease/2',3'-cyclic-nucleotide 2'-phosphodiesterase/5'-nucleotidase/3'-nucleotidase [Paraconexibacter algicola]|uniref:Multifunctional nuclease/2',3'-cyclic-nucleotide 2'-phosphodiesterase/5'-nucleotidase/3'-nucleotidase n=1 Tax=Paraconexibacter algicola TaxID=2133960 RepID=A0A2T4UKJ8_9ACTN|nr:multifunctional nuclease/2',3'-cyclic-nucleotide 2'-phosphodiesterase/5'-nucleotidase/3'-nucleotidase [Paraconexibacter algicola]